MDTPPTSQAIVARVSNWSIAPENVTRIPMILGNGQSTGPTRRCRASSVRRRTAFMQADQVDDLYS